MQKSLIAFLILSTCFLLTITSNSFAQLPKITSIDPVASEPGKTIIIKGSYFASNPELNKVFFGAVKANIVNATTSELIVEVPVNASYGPIELVTSSGTTYSSQHFIPTFPCGVQNTTILRNVFKPSFHLPIWTDIYPKNGIIQDFNNDGKPDMAIVADAEYPNAIYIVRNISDSTGISLKLEGSLHNGGYEPTDVVSSDLDGDGRYDLVVPSYSGDNVIFYKNTTASDSITFVEQQFLPLGDGANPRSIAIKDLDLDGRPDVVISNWGDYTTVLKNISSPGIIKFDRDFYNPSFYSSDISQSVLEDLNGDKKPEIISASNKAVYISKNESTPGNILFKYNGIDTLKIHEQGSSIVASDFNGDGKVDLAIGYGYEPASGGRITLFKNISHNDEISFMPMQDIPVPMIPSYLNIGDLDGNGKPDIIINSRVVVALLNSSVGDSIVFRQWQQIYNHPKADLYKLKINDLDGDHLPDVVTINERNSISVIRNTLGLTGTIKGNVDLCPDNDALLHIEFTGQPPYDVSYSDSEMVYLEKGIVENPYKLKVRPTKNSIYTLTTVASNNCTGNAFGNAQVRVRPQPDYTATVENNSSITWTFSGQGPWDVLYSDGNTLQLLQKINSPYSIETDPLKQYTIASIKDKYCIKDYSITGTQSKESSNAIKVIYSPDNANLIISILNSGLATLSDMQAKEIYSTMLLQGENTFLIKHIPQGVYFLSIIPVDTKVPIVKKIFIE